MCKRFLGSVMGISLLFSLPLGAARVKQIVRRPADAYEKHENDLQRMRQVRSVGIKKSIKARVKKVELAEADLESEVSLDAEVKPSAYHMKVCSGYVTYCQTMSEVYKDKGFLKDESYKTCVLVTNGSDTKYKLGALNLFTQRLQDYLDKKIYN